MARRTSLIAALAVLLAAVAVASGAPADRIDPRVSNDKKRHFKRPFAAVKASSKKFFDRASAISAGASSPSTAHEVAEFAVDRRGLATADDSLTCMYVTDVYKCQERYDEASCIAESSCKWTPYTPGSSYGECEFKPTPTQNATSTKFYDDYYKLLSKCDFPSLQASSSWVCPTDTCELVSTDCVVKQASLDAALPNDPALAKEVGWINRCPAYTSKGPCEAAKCKWWYGGSGYCDTDWAEVYKNLRSSIVECNAGGTPIGSKSAAEHVNDHNLCPLAIANVMCQQIQNETDCTMAKTSNTCMAYYSISSPSSAIFPCVTSYTVEETRDTFLYNTDMITAYDLALKCDHDTLATCMATADCEWDHKYDECLLSDETLYQAFSAHPHVNMMGKALSSCSALGETACRTANDTCVWAPKIENVPGECLPTTANYASHLACECDSVEKTFPDLKLDKSVCVASEKNSSPATKTLVGIVVTLVAVFFSS